MSLELWSGHNGAKEGENLKERKRVPLRKKYAENNNRVFTVVDPLHRETIKPTGGGDILPDPSTGYYTVQSPMLASEIKARYPWCLVTEHEKFQGDPTRASVFRVSGMREGKLSDEEMIADGWVKDGVRWVKRT